MDRRYVMAGALSLFAMGLSEEALAKLGLSDKDAQSGLRQILKQGTEAAVTRLSQTNGYWNDSAVRIPLPKTLAQTQKLLKPIGQSSVLDDLHLRMNRAAETAAPVAKGLFVDAIQSMTIKDAVGIVKGGNTSGTDYLKKTTTPRLTTAFTPPMQSAMQATGAVDYFDRAIRRNNLQSYFKTDAKTYLGDYAVGLALQGLFHYVGTEEVAIRRDPAKRTTDILKTLFG
ncbi:DUF4197 domain-containing protein [Asticcacaulis benevestitus]|nr:DUF4197 domain-containing protein [Asticcacaulis benevestitus]